MATVDTRFVREGRSLREWMLQLVSADRAGRRAAENAVSAMFYGLPTADSSFEESIIKDVHEHQAAFYAAVEAVGGDASFPARTFMPAAVDRMLAAHREHMESVDAEDALMDEWMDAPGDPMEDPAIAARMEQLKRRKVDEHAGRARMSFGDQTVNVVFQHLGKALLVAPDAVRRALAEPVVARTATDGLKRLGPAAIQYAETFIEELDRSTEWFRSADVLGAIGRGSAHVVDAMIARVRHAWGVVRGGAISTLANLGTEVASRENEIVSMLIGIVRAPEDDARHTALAALGSVGRNLEDALKVVMECAAPRPPRMRKMPGTEYEYDEVMFERGVALSALGNFVRFAERVTPVLVDALDSFEEFDPDEMRDDDGGYGRVMDAVRKLGPGAAGAAAALAERLRANDGGVCWGIVRALGEMGPPASGALPALERLRCELDGDDDASDDDRVLKAIRQIRG